MAWRFLPIFTIAYVLNYLDRTSVGFAALTMNRDIGLTAYEFGWGAGLLFASYSVFEIPSNLILYRFGARRWIARIMITWGVVAAANAFVVGPTSFYIVRLLLGAAEAGFFPGITFFLAAWFPAQYRARVLAWFLVAIPVSSVLGGPVSGLLLQMDGLAGLAGWQWMFIVEGLPASIVGLFILMMVSDRPEEAAWLSAEERAAMGAMLAEEQRDRARHSLLSAIKDVRVLILTGIQFGYTLGSYGIGIWLPQILKTHGLSNLAVGFVSAIPYLFASVAMLVWAAYVDRAGRKILNLTLGFFAGNGRLCPVGRVDGPDAGVDRPDSRAGRRHLGAGDLLDCADQFPDWTRSRRRACLHHDDRLAGRLLRPVPCRLDQGINRFVHHGPARHGRYPCGDHGLGGGAAVIHPQGIGGACGQPRPIYGIFVAITVMKWTFASSGRLAI